MSNPPPAPVGPALSASEWARYPDVGRQFDNLPVDEPLPVYHRTRHGIAAANLHRQPFGFSHQDVEWCNGFADEARAADGHGGESEAAMRSLAARIKALLPPQGR